MIEIWKIYKVYCTKCEEVIEWCETKREADHIAGIHKFRYHTDVLRFAL